MALLFGVATLLQLNDPDPIRWILIYGCASALATFAAVRSRVPVFIICALGSLALIWAVGVELQIDRRIHVGELFQSWKMYDEGVELAREAGGLFIVAIWSLTLVVCAFLLNREKP
jgi:hypothetical protein